MMKALHWIVKSLSGILLIYLILDFPTSCGMVIWRCPEASILQCRQLPPQCRSFRMIYIRHGFLDCPGCLVCADPWYPPKGWSAAQVTKDEKQAKDKNKQKSWMPNSKKHKKRRRKEKLKAQKRRQKRRERRKRRRDRMNIVRRKRLT